MARKGNPISVRLDLNRSSDSSWFSFQFLLRKIRNKLSTEREAIRHFFVIGYMIASFGIFVWSFQTMFSEIGRETLANPLQVLAQLSCFLFHFEFVTKKEERARHLAGLCCLFSIVSSLYLNLRGTDLEFILVALILFYCLFICVFPLGYAIPFVLLFYSLEQGLAKWAFFLAFQQVAYYVLSFLLDKEQFPPIKGILPLAFLQILQFLIGFFYYSKCYLEEPTKLAALLSGACILFLSFKKRSKSAFRIASFFYFFLSIGIGLASAPTGIDTTEDYQIPFEGIFIFCFAHLFCFIGFKLFNKSLPHEKQPLIPFFFSALFYFLPFFPGLFWLKRWIEGIDLLLFLLCLFLFIREEGKMRRGGGR